MAVAPAAGGDGGAAAIKSTVLGTVAKLNGIALTDQSPVGWAVVCGTAPLARIFTLTEDDAARVLGQGAATPGAGPATGQGVSPGSARLEIKPGPDVMGAKPVTVTGLTVMHRAPSGVPFLGNVVVCDKRWKWPYVHVHKSYNVRRRTGVWRWRGDQRVKIDTPVASFYFAAWSLKTSGSEGAGPNQGAPGAIVADPSRWTALDVLIDVISIVDGRAPIVDGQLQQKNRVSIEGLELDDPGDDAIARVLGYVAGAEIYVDLDGKTHIFDRFEGGEDTVLAKTGPPTELSPLATKIDRSAQRPPTTVSLFDREHELRFDYTETGGNSSGTAAALPYDARYMENVMPLPCPGASASLIGLGSGILAEGTWITIQQSLTLFAAMRASFGIPAFVLPLTRDALLKLWNTPGKLEDSFANPFGSPVLHKWIQGFRSHFRQTFRLNPRWRDRLRALRAYRVAVINQATGTRAPALVYMDYAIRQGIRPFQTQSGQGAKNSAGEVMEIFKNVYARSDKEAWSENSKLGDGVPAQALVSVLDEDQAIVHASFAMDRFGDAQGFSPGIIKSPIPRGDAAWDGDSTGSFAELVSTFSCSFLLTGVAAAPNDIRRLYAAPVPWDGSEKALGPVRYVRVSNGTTTARFAWSDQFATQIDAAFAASAGLSNDALDQLIVNQDEIQAVATAMNQRVHLLFKDRVEGVHEVVMDGSINKLRGGISAIAYTLNPNGTCLMRFELPPIVGAPDLYALLSEGARRKIYRMVPS